MLPDQDRLWRALEARDHRFDGWVFSAVRTTGIYCRPSCPARTPKRGNVRFFTTAAAAQAAGFRACKRCRPDATPGSPEWDRRADLVGRAMRLIADGVVDREGVSGLARRLGYSERHVHRELVAVIGVGPLALARAQRAQTARVLLEATAAPIGEVALAAGFRSLRQFNATVREVFATTPSALRARVRIPRHGGSPHPRRRASAPPGSIELRLPYRGPFDGAGVIDFLARRAVPGVEEVFEHGYRRSLRLPHGSGVVELQLTGGNGHLSARYWLQDLRDLGPAVQRSRALLDLDSDPQAVVEALGGDDLLGCLVRAAPGRRVVGHVDADELAVRAVLGQQISLAGASTLARRLVIEYGERLPRPVQGVTHLFPTASVLAELDPSRLAMPASRRRAVIAMCEALASGQLVIDEGGDRDAARRRLLALPGVGAWTAGYIAIRALRDPDAFIAGDLGVRHAIERLGEDGRPGNAERLAERWRPYRAYALQHLWASLGPAAPAPTGERTSRGRAPAAIGPPPSRDVSPVGVGEVAPVPG